MKKLLLLSLTTLTLAACSSNSASTSSAASSTQATTSSAVTTVAISSSQAATQTITMNITQDGEPIEGSPFTVEVAEGTSLLDAMKAQFTVVEADGFISSINGIEQDAANNKYWLFDVNGEMSQVGAADVVLKDGDVIDWKLEAFQQ